MKLSVATFLLASVATTLSSPLKLAVRDQQSVDAAIAQWTNDVDIVTNVLNEIESSNDPAGLAQQAVDAENDEPTQLKACQLAPGLSAQGQDAANTLVEVTPSIPAAFQSIVDDPTASNVRTQVDAINTLRCNVVLPDVDTVWDAAAAAVNSSAPAPANRPLACGASSASSASGYRRHH